MTTLTLSEREIALAALKPFVKTLEAWRLPPRHYLNFTRAMAQNSDVSDFDRAATVYAALLKEKGDRTVKQSLTTEQPKDPAP